MNESVKEYCMRCGREALLAQWDFKSNAGLTPENLTYGSNRMVWWICERGHRWRAKVKSRCCDNVGCPVCSGRKVLKGENDLASVLPEVAKQWHPYKNGCLRPYDVVVSTHKKVWWICEKGHEWQATVASRTSGAGCPVCAGKLIIAGENDLESRYPQIAAEWSMDKNGSLTPDMVAPYSNKRVWWRCGMGHEYQAAVCARTMHGSGCPYCTGHKTLAGFNDLATLEPRLASQWHTALNGSLTPQMVTTGSRKKVWWQCPSGHVWMAVIYSRTGPNRCGCPVCAGRVRVTKVEQYAAMSRPSVSAVRR